MCTLMKRTARPRSELPIITDDAQVGAHGTMASMNKAAIGTML